MSYKVSIDPLTQQVRVSGTIEDNVINGTIQYVAAAPAERRATYTGSCLPYANTQQAFDSTPNQGTQELKRNNTFDITISIPNSYYINLGTVMIPPTLYIMYNGGKKVISIRVGNPIAYRTLTYPSTRRNCNFYDGRDAMPIRTQEQILRDSGYPSTHIEHTNFWGLKPPTP